LYYALVLKVLESVIAKDHALVAAEKLNVVTCVSRYALVFENAKMTHQVAMFSQIYPNDDAVILLCSAPFLLHSSKRQVILGEEENQEYRSQYRKMLLDD